MGIPIPVPSPTIEAIDAHYAAKEKREQYRYLRGSEIGKPCERSIWYSFRWTDEPEQFDGRKLRLFQTGHIAEAALIDNLRSAGVTVAATDPLNGMQWRVTALEGHFRGHLDGILVGLIEAPKTEHLLEVKTHNTKSFTELKKHGVNVSKPQHVVQMQAYMGLKGLTRAFYLAKCKDTDELYSERIDFDPVHFAAIMAKAERILKADEPPAKIDERPDYYLCRMCSRHAVCHEDKPPLRNCRTCLHSMTGPTGAWHCARHQIELTAQHQEAGCPHHLYLPGLVPGEQIDADETRETVTYRMADGSEWTDGQERANDQA
jgi:hypothetical protein